MTLDEYVLKVCSTSLLNALRVVHGYVFDSGNIVGVVINRHEQFQTELFIVRPGNQGFPKLHSHPDIDSYEMHMAGDIMFSLDIDPIDPPLETSPSGPDGCHPSINALKRVNPGQLHGATVGHAGGMFLSFQHWLNGVKPTSVTLNWEGPPLNPLHETTLL